MSAQDYVWTISGEPHVILRMKRVFERADKQTPGMIRLANTAENCRELEWFTQRYPMEISPKQLEILKQGAAAHLENMTTLEQILSGKHNTKKIDLALPIRDYQRIAAEMVWKKRRLLIGDDVGLGKTAESIACLVKPELRPALVVTLAHLPRQWASELKKFAPQLSTCILKLGKPYPIKQNGQFPDVIIANYHKLNGWADVLKGTVKSVIFDECQELRRSESQKYYAAKMIADAADYVVGASATPIFNLGEEMWHVCNVLCPNVLGDYDEFFREWCVGKGSVKDPRAFGSYLRENHIMLRRTRKEVGREIPDVIRVPHSIDSDSSAIDQIKGSAAELAKLILSGAGVEKGERFTASGQFDAIMRQATGIAKAPYVADFVRIIAESGEKVVLYGWHHSVYKIWMEKLADLKPVMYTGDETETQKDAAKKAFVEGEAKILIISLRAGAGLDGLQHVASVCVIGEMDWSAGVHTQCEGRLARDGQTKPVVTYFMISEDGCDPIMADVLGLKEQQVQGITNPDSEYIEKLQSTSEHIKKLAAHFLAKQEPIELEEL